MMARFGLLMALCLASPARAVDVRIEVGPFGLVPLGPILDGQASTISNFDLGSLGLQGGTQDITALTDVTHSSGGGFSLSLLLNQWEIRYEFGVLPYDEVNLTHLGIVAGDLSLYFKTEDLLGQSISGDSSELDPAMFHSIGFGYRFEPFPEWTVSPYVPFGLGFAVAMPRNDVDPMFGFNIQLGVGAHALLGEHFDLGLAVRYGLSAFKNTDTSISALTQGASASVSTGSSAFDAAVEVLQAVSISVTLGFSL